MWYNALYIYLEDFFQSVVVDSSLDRHSGYVHFLTFKLTSVMKDVGLDEMTFYFTPVKNFYCSGIHFSSRVGWR